MKKSTFAWMLMGAVGVGLLFPDVSLAQRWGGGRGGSGFSASVGPFSYSQFNGNFGRGYGGWNNGWGGYGPYNRGFGPGIGIGIGSGWNSGYRNYGYSQPYYSSGGTYYSEPGVVYSQAPAAAMPSGSTSFYSGPGYATSTNSGQSGTIVVHAHPDAQVFYDGMASSLRGPERVYQTSALDATNGHTYKIEARFADQNGQMQTQTREVKVMPGATVHVDFTRPEGEQRNQDGNRPSNQTQNNNPQQQDNNARPSNRTLPQQPQQPQQPRQNNNVPQD